MRTLDPRRLEAEDTDDRWRGTVHSTSVPMVVDQSSKRLKPTADSVDLSRVDSSLVAQIASFVGTAHELLNLALTCKSFGGLPSGWALDWSLAEEVAREAIFSGRNNIEGVHVTLPPRVGGTTTWLAVLHESENPLKFDTLWGNGIEHVEGRKSVVRRVVNSLSSLSAAVASNYVMQSGIHYAEFHITGSALIGVVRPLNLYLSPERYANRYFNFFDSSLFSDFLAARTDAWGCGNVHSCRYSSAYGEMRWTNWDDFPSSPGPGLEWEGMEVCQPGDTVGMLLDLNEGTLSVYKNNRRLGVMKDGLDGSYCWNVSVWEGVEVAIKKGEPRFHSQRRG